MDKPEKADLKSMDVADDKRRQLAQIFPEVMTEARTEDGKLVHAVDYERLKGVLGEFSEILENQRERYGMSWPGKNECLKIIQQPSIATLKPCRDESVNFDKTENLFIEGDNLEALKLLQKAYYGKVKMIYIDPPYNTGNDFIYPDDFGETIETYLTYTGQIDSEGRQFATNTDSSGRFHTKWINMMYPRLYLAKNLLREDGLVFISIDDMEAKNLRRICDEVFGEENFVEQVIWKNKYGSGALTKGFANVHEYILCYSKTPIVNVTSPLSEEAKKAYKGRDAKYATRRGFITQPLATTSKDDRPNLRYPIHHEGHEIWPEKQWIWSEERFKHAYENDEIIINEKDGNFSVRMKQYLLNEDGRERKGKPISILLGPFNQEGTKEIKALFDGKDVFGFPKPSSLIQYFFSFAVNDEEDTGGLFLDFFAGSCPMAQAVLDLNKKDGGTRQFICIQLPEETEEMSLACKEGFKTIAEIGKERIRRITAKQQEEEARKLALSSTMQDLGFRVFKLDRSNFRLWDGSESGKDPEKIAEQLELHEQHIDPNAKQEDILYELLLKAGFLLTTKVEKVDMAGKEVFSVAEGALLICLQGEITKELIKAMADADPLQVICLDSGFRNNDQLKANAVQTFKARNRGKEKESGIVFRTV